MYLKVIKHWPSQQIYFSEPLAKRGTYPLLLIQPCFSLVFLKLEYNGKSCPRVMTWFHATGNTMDRILHLLSSPCKLTETNLTLSSEYLSQAPSPKQSPEKSVDCGRILRQLPGPLSWPQSLPGTGWSACSHFTTWGKNPSKNKAGTPLPYVASSKSKLLVQTQQGASLPVILHCVCTLQLGT